MKLIRINPSKGPTPGTHYWVAADNGVQYLKSVFDGDRAYYRRCPFQPGQRSRMLPPTATRVRAAIDAAIAKGL